MVESYPKWVENTVGKGNFSFSHSVFKRLVSQGCQKVSLWVKAENDGHQNIILLYRNISKSFLKVLKLAKGPI